MYHSPAPASLLFFLVLQTQLNHILGPFARPIDQSNNLLVLICCITAGWPIF